MCWTERRVGDLGRDMTAVWLAADNGNDLIESLDVASERGVISGEIFDALRDFLKDGTPFSFDSALVDLKKRGYLRRVGRLAHSTTLHKFYCLLWKRVKKNSALPTDAELMREGCVAMIVLIQDWSLGCDGSNSLLINRVGE